MTIKDDEGMRFERARVDPDSGQAFLRLDRAVARIRHVHPRAGRPPDRRSVRDADGGALSWTRHAHGRSRRKRVAIEKRSRRQRSRHRKGDST